MEAEFGERGSTRCIFNAQFTATVAGGWRMRGAVGTTFIGSRATSGYLTRALTELSNRSL